MTTLAMRPDEGPTGPGASDNSPRGCRHDFGSHALFPLPLLPAPPGLGHSGGRRRRWGEHDAVLRETNKTVKSLNWMHGHRHGSGSYEATGDQSHVLARVWGLHSSRRPPADAPCEEAALKKLLKGRSIYCTDLAGRNIATFRPGAVSLPDHIHDARALDELVGSEMHKVLEGGMKRMGAEVVNFSDLPCAYWDPTLRGKTYVAFLKDLDGRGLLQFTLHKKEEAGIFFVSKKSGALRLILDGRRGNKHLARPPHVSLATVEAFSNAEVEPPEEYSQDAEGARQFLKDEGLYVGTADVMDCFHRLRIPLWLAELYCLRPVPAWQLGLQGKIISGAVVERDTVVYPCPATLPMGCSWSVAFCQDIGEKQAAKVRGLKEARRISDRGDRLLLARFPGGRAADSQMYYYVYVDNLGVISLHAESVVQSLADLASHFNGIGLKIHDLEVHHVKANILGVSLDLKEGHSQITDERFFALRSGIRALIRRGRCSGQALEVLVGHLTYAGLSNRGCLTMLNGVYKFIHQFYFSAGRL